MLKLMPKYVLCPVCGGRFTNRGLLNHVRIKHPGAKASIEKVRKTVGGWSEYQK
jgi:hypothetical protein